MKLYEIVEQIKILEEDEEQSDSMDMTLFKEVMDRLEGDLKDKCENIARLYFNLKSTQENLAMEINRLNGKKITVGNRLTWIKEYLKDQLVFAGRDKVQTNIATISIRKNPPSVNVIDPTAIPEEYMKVFVEPKKKAIMEHFEDTGEILPGCEIITDAKGLQIR